MGDPWLSSVTVEKLATKSGVELISLAEAKHYPQEHWSKLIPRLLIFLDAKPKELFKVMQKLSQLPFSDYSRSGGFAFSKFLRLGLVIYRYNKKLLKFK